MKTAEPKRRKASVGPDGIIKAAERLMGTEGIDGISLRQIAAAAGLANNYSVQYHFGDRDELVRAILDWRLPQLDARRAILLADARSAPAGLTPASLFECLAKPIAEMAGEPETSHFVKFLIQLVRSPRQRQLRVDLDMLTPAAVEIVQNLRTRLPHLNDTAFNFRVIGSWLTVLEAIAFPEIFQQPDGSSLTRDEVYLEAIAAAVGSLSAPPSRNG